MESGLCVTVRSTWNMQISVDELESSISVKISKEAVMSINSPESLFTAVNGKLVTTVYIAGLPNRTDVIKPVSELSESMRTQWIILVWHVAPSNEITQTTLRWIYQGLHWASSKPVLCSLYVSIH